MTKRIEAAKRAWVTIRKRYAKGELARKAWHTRRNNLIMNMTEEDYLDYVLEEYKKEHVTEEFKKLRRLIIKAGGINDRDYEDIPPWAKRKNGRTLDEHVGEIAGEGYPVRTANDLYELITRGITA